MISKSFSAIGTSWSIDLYIKDLKKSRIFQQIDELIESFDKTYSRFRTDSWVYNCYRKKGIYKMPKDFIELYEIYQKLYSATNGLFTPLIGRTLSDAGYDKDYSLKSKENIYRPSDFYETIQVTNSNIYFKEKVLLDFGACGKGYLVDQISELLIKNNIKNYTIDAGGDIFVSLNNLEPIRIGLEHPDDPSLAIGVIELNSGSICASAGNRRKWGNYHHTINPKTLTSPTDIKATWVVAKRTIIADALATCLILDPNPEKFDEFNFEYLLLYKDNTYKKSEYFKAQIFT